MQRHQPVGDVGGYLVLHGYPGTKEEWLADLKASQNKLWRGNRLIGQDPTSLPGALRRLGQALGVGEFNISATPLPPGSPLTQEDRP